jgi:hypothetical protein
MFRHMAVAACLALTCTSLLIAQDKTSKPPAKAAPKVITLSGCVVRSDTGPNHYTIEDAEAGVKFRLTGTDVRDFIGKKVEILGAVPSRRLVIVGGLTPNANVAAQAGAMDPVQAAVASAGGVAGPGNVELPEFKVKSVRPVSGDCPD